MTAIVPSTPDTPHRLGPWSGTYHPSYALSFYKNGDPSQRVKASELDLNSVTQINTNKNLTNTVGVGTWQITFKDGRAMNAIRPMDVVVIRLKGHNDGFSTVIRGVVDTVQPAEQADATSAREDVVVQGRCMAKYLASNSLFLPVWSPQYNLPTALIFGIGDVTKKTAPGSNVIDASTPKGIFGYIYVHYIVGARNSVGLSGTPNARYWLNKDNRFEFVTDARGQLFKIPYIQFDEDTCDVALSELEITGFTEAWVDEIGNVVYRRPQWSAPVSYILHTAGEINGELPVSDVGLTTYVEVVPSANPGIGTAQSQALLAGRAPVPSDYISNTNASNPSGPYADPEFIIETNGKGQPTAKGLRNPWYQRQRKYGLRPYQVTSPLLWDQAQAQQQAEGLLQFTNRLQKTGTITIPGEPSIRVGTTIQIVGTHRGVAINRTFYIDGVEHDYVDGDHYTTTLTLSHGRDPGDPGWTGMAIGNTSPKSLVVTAGVLTSPATTTSGMTQIGGTTGVIQSGGQAAIPEGVPAAVQEMVAAGNELVGTTYEYGGAHGKPRTNLYGSYDCSSSVAYILYAAGLVDATTNYVSGDFESMFQPGVGEYVTVWANATHVWMQIAGLVWSDGGPNGTPAVWTTTPLPTATYTAVHPQGL